MNPDSSALAPYFAKQGHNDTGIDRSLAAVVPERLVDAVTPQSAASCLVGMWLAFDAENKRRQGLAVINR
ncbi:MAG: hypothetical protein ACOX9E_07870 [Lentisphaeria bacterium]|jgi:hypothetical protein